MGTNHQNPNDGFPDREYLEDLRLQAKDVLSHRHSLREKRGIYLEITRRYFKAYEFITPELFKDALKFTNKSFPLSFSYLGHQALLSGEWDLLTEYRNIASANDYFKYAFKLLNRKCHSNLIGTSKVIAMYKLRAKSLYLLTKGFQSSKDLQYLKSKKYLKHALKSFLQLHIDPKQRKPLIPLFNLSIRIELLEATLENAWTGASFKELLHNLSDAEQNIRIQLIDSRQNDLFRNEFLLRVFKAKLYCLQACKRILTICATNPNRLRRFGEKRNLPPMQEHQLKTALETFEQHKYLPGIALVTQLEEFILRVIKLAVIYGFNNIPNQENEIENIKSAIFKANNPNTEKEILNSLLKTTKAIPISISHALDAERQRLETVISVGFKDIGTRISGIAPGKLSPPLKTNPVKAGAFKPEKNIIVYINGHTSPSLFTKAEIMQRRRIWIKKYLFLYDDVAHELYINRKKISPPTASTRKLLILVLKSIGRYITDEHIKNTLSQSSASTARPISLMYAATRGRLANFVHKERGSGRYRICENLPGCLILMPDDPLDA